MVKRLVCFAIICLIAFGMCACFEAPHSYMCDVEYEKTEYDINDVTLNFCFGPHEREIKESLNGGNGVWIYGNVQLFFLNQQAELNLKIREISKNEFFSEAYRQENDMGTKAVYNHSEMITIPKEMFIQEEGSVYFGLTIERTRIETGKFEPIEIGATIHYKLEGNKVTINSINPIC